MKLSTWREYCVCVRYDTYFTTTNNVLGPPRQNADSDYVLKKKIKGMTSAEKDHKPSPTTPEALSRYGALSRTIFVLGGGRGKGGGCDDLFTYVDCKSLKVPKISIYMICICDGCGLHMWRDFTTHATLYDLRRVCLSVCTHDGAFEARPRNM